MQFTEPKSSVGKCPVCGKEVTVRSTREPAPFCSKVCATTKTHSQRYRGSLSGPKDRPENLSDRTKFRS